MFLLEQYRALQVGAGFLRREDRGRILLRGADRKAYLHGLLSNDTLSLEAGGWCYATMLTAQGRMISDMRVFELGATTLIDLERPVSATVCEHLDRFVITEDVVIEEVTSTYAQIGLYGPTFSDVMADATASDPSIAPSYILPSSDIGVEGVDLIIPDGSADVLCLALERSGAVPIDAETADVTRIEAGIPKFLIDMDTSTIPLEAGIERRAISLTKGCYVGQEVIIRVLHRGGGRVARKLVGLTVAGADAERHDRVNKGDREIGRVTSVAHSPRAGQQIALASVHRDFVAPGTGLTIVTTDGPSPAVVTTLPFGRE